MNELQIFLAEDNPADVGIIKLALDHSGIEYRLTLASDGADAIELIRKMGQPNQLVCPDVMLLDLNLPRVSGAQLLAEFRKNPECEDTPVIVVTSKTTKAELAELARLGP